MFVIIARIINTEPIKTHKLHHQLRPVYVDFHLYLLSC